MTRIRVDLNSRIQNGWVQASSSLADGPVSFGEQLIAYDPGEPDTEYVVRVVERDVSGRLFLEIVGVHS